MDALESAVAQQREQADHERRLAYIEANGWEVTPEGWVKDTSDSRWHTTSREVVKYDPGLTFQESVQVAWSHQKALEAKELAAEQRRRQGKR